MDGNSRWGRGGLYRRGGYFVVGGEEKKKDGADLVLNVFIYDPEEAGGVPLLEFLIDV